MPRPFYPKRRKPGCGARIDRNHPLAKGLVGCWLIHEGGGTIVRDISGFGNDGTMTNMDPATDWIASERGVALDLDGGNDYVDCGDITGLDGATQMSIAILVNVAAFNVDDKFVAKLGGAGNRTFQFTLWSLVANEFALDVWDGANRCMGHTTTASLITETWYMLGGVWHGGNSLALYSDGVALPVTYNKLDNPGSLTDSSVTLDFGRQAGGNYLAAQFASVSLWDRALTASEVLALYESPYDFLISPGERRYAVKAPAAAGIAWPAFSAADHSPAFGGLGVR